MCDSMYTHMPVSAGFTLGTCGWLPRGRRRRRGRRRQDSPKYSRHILDKKGAAVI